MTGQPPDPPPKDLRSLPGNRWEVQLLGGLSVRSGDFEVPRIAERAVRLLLVRLALQPRIEHGRDGLAQALWPEVPGDDGRERADAARVRRDRLKRALSDLKRALTAGGASHVNPFIAHRDTLRLNAAAFDIDVLRFEQQIARRHWAAARASYRGELVPDLQDPWVEEQRVLLAAARARADAEDAAPDADTGDTFDAEFDDAGQAWDPSASAARPPVVPFVPRFFGREAEVEALRQALAAHRLVSLTGAAGCGKTWLAAEAARRLHGFRPVAMAWLEDCTTPAAVLDSLRRALGLHQTNQEVIGQIADCLDGRPALLVLDNFEQLVGGAGDALLTELLQRLPTTRWLVTSRRALLRADEHRIALQPLPLPDPGDDQAAALRNTAVALFVNRAQAARSHFSLNARNRHAVIEVCRLLEGLPLAIELAAAKIRSHRPAEMAKALGHSYKLLARPQLRTGTPRRHLSLDAALSWSWSLLDEAQRNLLRCLTVFRSGWTPAQALAVAQAAASTDALASAHAARPAAAADTSMDALVADSLVQTLPGVGGPTRHTLLGALRKFVQDQDTAAQAAALRRHHRAHFLALARQLEAQREWLDEADERNLVHAMATACADDEAETAAAIAVALAEPWRARGAPIPALDLLQAAAQVQRLGAAQRVAMLTLLSATLLSAGRGRDAQAHVKQALSLAGADRALRADAVLAQADVHWRAGRVPEEAARALALVQQAESLLAGLVQEGAATLQQHGRLLLIKGAITLQHGGDVGAAALMFEQAERIFGALGDRRAAVLALPGRVACLLKQQRYRELIAVATKGQQRAAELGDIVTQLQLFDRLSNAYEATGQPERALQACQSQTRLALKRGLHYYAAYGAWNQCHPLAQLNQSDLAARLMAFGEQYWVLQFGALEASDLAYVDRVRQLALGQIGAARLRSAWTLGRKLSVHSALELAAGRAGSECGLEPGP